MHQRPLPRVTIILACCLLAAFLGGGAPGANAAGAQLALTPTAGAAGARIGVTGSGFAPGIAGKLLLGGTQVGTFATSSTGAFQTLVAVPAGAAPGKTTLVAKNSGTRLASVPFTIIAAPSPSPSTVPTPAPTPVPTIAGGGGWRPALVTSWQLQLAGAPDLSLPVQLYDLDGFDTPGSAVAALHARGGRAVCYISAGSYEDWRPDAGQFPAAVLGNSNGWSGERWLDIRRLDILGPIMGARLDLCRQKGFDAVDPDNVDGYANTTGFPLTYQEQLSYNRWLAEQAHARGLAIGLKNDGDQVVDLVSVFDFAVVEQCFEYNECARYTPFIAAGKAVFEVEYNLPTDQFCPQANALNFNALKKGLGLGDYRVPCR